MKRSTPDRVPWRETVGLGAGKIVSDGSQLTVFTMVNPIYNVTMGLSPMGISAVLFAQRIWDAVVDPVVGQFSDNFRSRWGRRLPLLAAAALPLAALFTALWWFPRSAGNGWLFTYLLVLSLGFSAAHSLFTMPLLALLVEATDDYQERTRLAGLTQGYGFAFQILTQWLFPLTQLPVFRDPIAGLRWVSAVLGAIFLLAAILPVCLCPERKYRQVARQPRLALVASLRAAGSLDPYRTVLTAGFVQGLAYNVVGPLSFYMNVYYVFGGDLKASAVAIGVVGSSYHVAALLGSVLLFPWLSRFFDKRRIYQIAAAILIAGCAAKLFLYQTGHPWLQIWIIGANGLSAAGLNLVPLSMLGDLVDLDEERNGCRREGLFASVLTWTNKAAMSLGGFASGFLLVGIGFAAQRGAQAPATLAAMKYCYAFVPLVGAAAAAWIMDRYRLNESELRATRDRADRTASMAYAP